MKITLKPVARIALALAALTPAVAGTAAAAAASHGPDAPPAAAGLRVARAERTASTPAAGTRRWLALYQGTNGPGSGTSVTVSPDGSRVFVTGSDGNANPAEAYGTVAYNAATGARLWVATYSSPAGKNSATAVKVSPDGSKVFVTGTSQDPAGQQDYATVAYAAATGARLWVARYAGPAASTGNFASALAVSPDGSKVFVTGHTESGGGRTDSYATVAYAAATGARRWVAIYTGPAGSTGNFANAIAVSPDGSNVFVTGTSSGSMGSSGYATVDYAAVNGIALWVQRYHGPGAGASGGDSVAVSPGGNRVFVSGFSSARAPNGSAYATLAYNSRTGARLWLARYNGPISAIGGPDFLTVSPDGSRVFITGTSAEAKGPGFTDYATVAYAPATGARLWAARYGAPEGENTAASIAVSPDGSKVFVTGQSAGKPVGNVSNFQYATVAYSAATGSQRWVARFSLAPTAGASAQSVAVSPDGSTVFVTGSATTAKGTDYATIAYRA